ncbi:hypothetical protein C9F11_38075 [Streptomyces sp. YIM 121038]|uniref:hypothetical protein n=1 Tax=Streptomyces sp. YIM 121038 TaxID=2136401 RepID=UPI001110DF69|nr:hypothetical protein [Streptomyces sp. YIM 121038]QCX81198.1 hypothetical protein C9F11_38075 [Streptomyces sp. YIM 121038]
MSVRGLVPEPTPEQISMIMLRLMGAAQPREQQTLFRIGKRAGFLWTHRGCPHPKSVSLATDDHCLHCGAPKPKGKP